MKRNKQGHCPECNSVDICESGTDFNTEKKILSIIFMCYSCGADFIEVYTTKYIKTE